MHPEDDCVRAAPAEPPSPIRGGLNEYTAIEKGQTYGFQVGNDLAVTTLSAFPPQGGSFMGAFQANHTTTRGSQAAQSILIQIANQFPNN